MPEKEKFDCKDILLIVITCLLIIAVIAMCVFVSSYAIMNQRTNISDVNTSESCIVSQSLEREIADNYAMPDSNIVSYSYGNYFSDYANVDFSDVNGNVFYEATFTLDDLGIDDLPDYFQVTGIVYNIVILIFPSVDDTFQLQETSILVVGSESNSIYSYSSYTYELVYSWSYEEPINPPNRNSIFSAGDSISISARVDDYFDFVNGMEFEIEYEIEVTRVYGYNLTSFIENEKDNSYSDGYYDGEEDGYNEGYDVGNADGLETGYETGYDEGHDVGYDEGYDVGKADGYTEGYNVGYPAGYNDGYPIGVNIGKQEGKAEGYAEGKADGLTEGYETGYDEGYDIGYDAGVDSLDSLVEDGYNRGYDEGYDRGLVVGFNNGVEQSADYTFFSLITSVFDAPLRVILGEWVDTNNDGVVDELRGGFLNFYVPVLDVDLAPFIISIFTICIIIIVIRFVLARL